MTIVCPECGGPLPMRAQVRCPKCGELVTGRRGLPPPPPERIGFLPDWANAIGAILFGGLFLVVAANFVGDKNWGRAALTGGIGLVAVAGGVLVGYGWIKRR